MSNNNDLSASSNIIKIIFVDGPTGIGKDYFIENLCKNLDIQKTDLNYKVLRATDFVLKNAKSEDRKYTTYRTETEKIYSIFSGHLDMLCHINKFINSSEKDIDLIIVNRSFLSFLIYNIYPIINEYKNTDNSEIYNIQEILLKTYNALYSSLFCNTGSIFINLTTEDYGLDEKKI